MRPTYLEVEEHLVQQELAALLGHVAERPLDGGVAVGGLRGLRVLPLQAVDGLSEDDGHALPPGAPPL